MTIHYFVEYNSIKNNHRYRVDCGNSVSILEAVIYNHLSAGDLNLIVAPQLENDDNNDIENKIKEATHV